MDTPGSSGLNESSLGETIDDLIPNLPQLETYVEGWEDIGEISEDFSLLMPQIEQEHSETTNAEDYPPDENGQFISEPKVDQPDSDSPTSPSNRCHRANAESAPTTTDERVASEAQKSSPNTQKTRANAASRKARAKRKLERESLVARNKALCDEMHLFRKQVAKLQNEIQSLRWTSYEERVSALKAENLHLRTEMKRMKVVVSHINRMMTNFPEYRYSESEKTELVENVVKSTVGQVLSLCQASVRSDSWNVYQYFPKLKNMKEVKVVVRIQVLPVGSTPETATLLNIRQDLYNVSTAESERIKMLFCSDSMVEEKYKGLCRKLEGRKEVELDVSRLDLNPSRRVVSGNATKDVLKDVKVLRITNKNQSTECVDKMEMVVLGATADRAVDPIGFPGLENPIPNVQSNVGHNTLARRTEKEIASVYSYSLASPHVGEKVFPNPDNVQRYYGSDLADFSSYIFRQQESNKHVVTIIKSWPMNRKGKTGHISHSNFLTLEESTESPQGRIPSLVRLGLEFMDALLAPNMSHADRLAKLQSMSARTKSASASS